MTDTTRRTFLFGAMATAAGATWAEDWPARALRLICGYPAGSSPDVQARLVAEPLSRALRQPVVVENKPGAGGNIGAELLANAHDGHSIGIIGNGPLTSSPHLYPRLGYVPARDFAPIALVAAGPLVLVTPKALGLDTADKWVRYARAQGGKLAYGSSGAGAGTHLGMELLKQALGIQALHVPFAGAPAIINAMLGGQIHMALLPPSTVMPLVEGGKLDALLVSSARRSPLAPTLPSLEETGVRGVNIEVWNAIMAPASMPAAHRARLSTELQKILGARDIRQKLLVTGWKVDDTSPQALAQRIKADSEAYRELITRNGIRLE